MLIDASTLPDGSRIEADLVIIGGGLAGLGIASETLGRGLSVCIIESGAEKPESATQQLYEGSARLTAPGGAERDISDYLTSSRLRALGGSGNLWGGKCAPLDPVDFEERPWVDGSGWPLSRADLDPYYDRASDLLRIPRFDYDLSQPREPDRPPLVIDDNRNLTTVARFHTELTGRRGNAFTEFKDDLGGDPRLRIYLNANVVDIALNETGSAVTSLAIACLNGRRHAAIGRTYVLATGGIENARLLLASDGIHPAGIGNDNDLVGRTFNGHVTYGVRDGDDGLNSGVYLSRLQESFDLYAGRDVRETWGVTATAWAAQRRERLLNFTTTFNPARRRSDPTLLAACQTATLIDAELDDFRPDDRPVWRRYFPVYFMSEQVPNPVSRVTLSASRDVLDMRRVDLRWAFQDQDFEGLARSIDFFARELGRTSTGRVEWPLRQDDLLQIMNMSRHHTGTTRMHSDATRGVVDPDCRVYGVANLYVAGSSVFPTAGIANPTLTILALAIRLSDHVVASHGN